MLTVAAMASHPEYALHTLVTGNSGDAVVDRAEMVSRAEQQRLLPNTLLVCSPDAVDTGQAAAWLQVLAEQRAAGLVIADPSAQEIPAALLTAAHQAAFPLLHSTVPPAHWRRTLIPRVTEHRRQAADQHAARLSHLLDQLTASEDGFMGTGLIAWLARELDAEVELAPGRGHEDPVAPGNGSARPSGRRAVCCQPVGATGQVLTAHRALTAWTAPETDLIRRAAAVMALPAQRETHSAAKVKNSIRAVRLAVFQALMTGQIEAAQRILSFLSPWVLDAEGAQVGLVDCGAAPRSDQRRDEGFARQRDEVFARVEARIGDIGLAVRCPAFDGHVIVVAPHPDPSAYEAPAITALRSFVADGGPHLSLGISPVLPMVEIADGYGMAYEAIATARISPGRAAVATPAPGLLDALPQAAAQQWATSLLRPVLSQKGADYNLATVARVLEFEVAAVSKIFGIHRNTLSRRLRSTMQATGLNSARALDRITLSLALQIHAMHGPAPSHPVTHPVPGLADLLADPQVTAWATDTLAPLRQEQSDRRTLSGETITLTLRTWASQDFRVDAAAQFLDLRSTTVRGHIRAAEGLLGLVLLSSAGHLSGEEDGPRKQNGLRNLAAALHAMAGSPQLTLPDPTQPGTVPVNRGRGSKRASE
ncbi:hypothetical protein ACWCOW_40570 [Streptomyces sp. NPDC001939]